MYGVELYAAVLTVDAAGRTILLDWSVPAAAGEDG